MPAISAGMTLTYKRKKGNARANHLSERFLTIASTIFLINVSQFIKYLINFAA
jgi:hypothetical protein